MKYSLLSHILCYLMGIFLGITLINIILNFSLSLTTVFLGLNIYCLTLLSVMNDRLNHIIKLNQVQKQQLLNRRVHDEIQKLNIKFNQDYKKKK